MPVLNAKGEAEALCAQLNREGHVDACVTADSDVFLFGANCVIKHIQPNSKDPFECYHISDIEAGLGLRRKQLIAISILVGNDHNLSGVRGIGLETAHRFSKSFSEDEILDRLLEISRGGTVELNGIGSAEGDSMPTSDESPRKPKLLHCSLCGHPGSKRSHLKSACEYCSTTGEDCKQKAPGFKCICTSCDVDRKEKEQKKNGNWHIKVCRKIALEDFPHDLIMQMYLHNDNRLDDGRMISWTSPKTEMLVDYLAYHQQWEPSYTRKRMLPMLSTLFLRDVASNSENLLLCGQYEFDHIKRVKTRYAHQFYVVYWKKATRTMFADVETATSKGCNMLQDTKRADGLKYLTEDEVIIDLTEEPEKAMYTTAAEGEYLTDEHGVLEIHTEEAGRAEEVIDLTEEIDGPEVHSEDGCCYLSTDEDMELVRKAFPEKVNQFLKQKELKEVKSRNKRKVMHESSGGGESSGSTQLSITEFFRFSKGTCETKLEKHSGGSSSASKREQKEQLSNYSKSARRRLLFE